MCSLIQEHTLYESYITADQSQFVVEVSDKDIYNNPDLLDNLASLTEQIARLGQIADLRVEFTPIPRQQ